MKQIHAGLMANMLIKNTARWGALVSPLMMELPSWKRSHGINEYRRNENVRAHRAKRKAKKKMRQQSRKGQ